MSPQEGGIHHRGAEVAKLEEQNLIAGRLSRRANAAPFSVLSLTLVVRLPFHLINTTHDSPFNQTFILPSLRPLRLCGESVPFRGLWASAIHVSGICDGVPV